MKKAVTISYKSYMSCARRPPARSAHDAQRWRACSPGGHALAACPAADASDVTATSGDHPRQTGKATCSVDPSGRGKTDSLGSAPGGGAGSRERSSAPGTGSATARARRTRRPAADRPRGAIATEAERDKGHIFRQTGQTVMGPRRLPRLSRCETPIYAQDLQSATLSNPMYTYSKKFGFVMT